MGKYIATIIAVLYLVLGTIRWDILSQSLRGRGTLMAFLLIAISLIWFGDYLGMYKGGSITQETPGPILKLFGWFILLGIPLVFMLIYYH